MRHLSTRSSKKVSFQDVDPDTPQKTLNHYPSQPQISLNHNSHHHRNHFNSSTQLPPLETTYTAKDIPQANQVNGFPSRPQSSLLLRESMIDSSQAPNARYYN